MLLESLFAIQCMTEIIHTVSAPLLHIQEGVATITLNRPAQRNRLENEDLQTLLAHFQQVNQDQSVRVVVLTANTAGQPKPVFCAGYDIGGFDEEGQGPPHLKECPKLWLY
jgi:enoyl-CoA hydratase/carnithine racemase